MPRRLSWILRTTLIFASLYPVTAAAAMKPLPTWVVAAIGEHHASLSRDEIEEAGYLGKRVFEFISAERFDTGDEHAVFDESGRKICQFGGFVGHVTSGSCVIEKIIFVRTICAPKPQ